jgi:Domain of unknown function (DUF4192)
MTKHQPDFQFNRPGALIAAIPAVLGFVPEKSLVLVALERGVIGPVMRVDLSEQLADLVDHIAELAAAGPADAAVAVIVDAEGARCPMCNAEYQELITALSMALCGHGIAMVGAHVVDQVAAEGCWHCADGCGAGGPVDDPLASPLAVAAVLDGRRLYARRGDLQGVIEIIDHAATGRLCTVIRALAESRSSERRGDPAARRDVEDAMTAAARIADGHELSDAELAQLACALTDAQVRDTLYALAVGENAAEAESLWAVLSRMLPEPWRVEALVLLAFSAYARGDGPLAGMSLEAALRCDPSHRMAGMLDTALQSAMRPEQIRELAGTGYRLATRLGVRLPPRQAFGQRAG